MAPTNHVESAGQRQSISQIETVLRMDVDIYRKFAWDGIEIRRLIAARQLIGQRHFIHIYIKGKQARWRDPAMKGGSMLCISGRVYSQ